MKDKSFDYNIYLEDIHTTGRIGLSLGLLMLLAAPFLFALVSGAHFNLQGLWPALVKVLIIYIPSSIVEFLIYVPMLGPGACYLAFITGNITNLKIPCAFSARDIAKSEIGTPEDEIISTLSVATSSLITMLVIFLGVLLLIPLTPVLENPVMKPAFDNLLPALFGALSMQYFKKNVKLAVFPLAFMVVLCVLIPSMITQTSTLLIANGAIAIGLAYLMFKKNWL
ncbi:MAG: hypothetical protein WCR02_09400 [Sphaerochaetaceae bacterium]|jgi:hypothetical protein